MQIGAQGTRYLARLGWRAVRLQSDRSEEKRITAEAFGEGRKGQNCPQAPRISSFLMDSRART